MTEPEPRKEPDKTPAVPANVIDAIDWLRSHAGHVLVLDPAMPPEEQTQEARQAEAKQADELLVSMDQRLTALEDDTRKLMWRYGL